MRRDYAAWAMALAAVTGSVSVLALNQARRTQLWSAATKWFKPQKLTPSGNSARQKIHRARHMDGLNGLPLPVGNPIPKTMHKTVHAADLKPGRLIIVGDIHGCVDELHALLDKVAFSHDIDNLIFAGDLVNKGPSSVEVSNTMRSTPRGSSPSQVTVCGGR